ncbi:MAG TPA: molybdate ABC transporter substrate-binding protein [Xanthobacteraceae bacterium]|jgi:molybdenum ABC transporter molybdate-binding protein
MRSFRVDEPQRAGGRAPRRARLTIAAALLCAAAFAAPAVAQARDLVVLGEPTLEKALKSVGALWQARTGTRVNVFVAPTDLSYAQIDRGARCDVIFALAGAATEAAARNDIIHATTVARVLRNGLVLVGTGESRASDKDASPAELVRLIAGKRLAIADPDRDVAGAYAADLLRKSGIVVGDRNQAAAVAESTAGVLNMLATGKARLGLVYATDAMAPFQIVARLAVPDRPPIDYVAAQARDPASDTQPFLAFLKSAEARAAFKSAGLTPIEADNGAAEAGRQK